MQAKGILAIEVFAELCRRTGDAGTNCSHYFAVASEYALLIPAWVDRALM